MQKNLVILGSGESGTGAALLGKHLGYTVLVSDKGAIKDVYKAELTANNIAWEENQHSTDRILAAQLIIKSPGIPEKTEIMQAIRAKGIETIGEIEFAWRHRPEGCTIVAITGSNGKTTTTHLTDHLLKNSGFDVKMGGNVGYSFARLVLPAETNHTSTWQGIYVLELSSFQLDDCVTFRPDIAMLLNITPDHLDRYDYQMLNYVRSKFRITMNQRGNDLLIINADDSNIQDFWKAHPEAVQCATQQVGQSDLKNGYVCVDELHFDLSGSHLKGPHNLFNAACSIRAALHLGAREDDLFGAILSFMPPPHRLEKVATVQDVTYINDSKATNVDSVFYALQAMDTPTIWIAGGTDKGNDYTPLFPHVRKIVKAIVCMGVDNSKLISTFGSFGLPMSEARSAQEAVEQAAALAVAGDTVLLSPACASFDLFKNYEDRGDQFKAAVNRLNT